MAASVPALATTRTVTTLADSGAGSLRQAIAVAAENDIIEAAPALNGGTIILTSVQLTIGKSLVIRGLGRTNLTISGNGARRIFNISSGVVVSISDLTLSRGVVQGTNGTKVEMKSTGSGTPGENVQGGGILNQGTLNLSNCVIHNCFVTAGDGGYDPTAVYRGGEGSGGGIANLGTLSLVACLFEGNSAHGGSGGTTLPISPTNTFGYHGADGGMARGGALANHGTLTLLNCTLLNSLVEGGTGSASHGSGFGITAGRGGAAAGGAIWNPTSPFLALTNCTLNDNSALAGTGGFTDGDRTYAGLGGTGNGGAIESDSPLNLANCTLNGNIARGGEGGDVRYWGPPADPDLRGFPADGGSATGGAIASTDFIQLTSSTLANNSAFGGNAGNGYYASGGDAGGGGLSQSVAVGRIRSTIIAGNLVAIGTGTGADDSSGPDVAGAISSEGYNFIGNSDGSSGWIGTDQHGTANSPLNPLLGALQDNGGRTFTMALSPGSPAIGTGDDTLLAELFADQRGSPRQTGTHVDVGAYEAGTYPVINLNDNGPGSLRHAISAAPATDTIVFANGVRGTIILTSGQITINTGRSIIGPSLGVTVSGNNASRVVSVESNVTAWIANLTFSNGRVTGSSGVSVFGGGVLNEGTLVLSNCTLRNNFVRGGDGGMGAFGAGGGAANLGTLTLANCTLAINSAMGGNGGSLGVGAGGGLANRGTLAVRSCTLSGNSAVGGNSGAGNGGGIYQFSGVGTTRLRNTLIANDTASGSSSAGPDVFGAVISQGYNLAAKRDGSSGWGATDLTGTSASPFNPLLGPLQNNGGPTMTFALLTGSPAIDQGSSGGVTIDQRGLLRPTDFPAIANGASGDGSDIGAYELQNPAMDIGLRAYDGTAIIKLAFEPGLLVSPLRISKNGMTYGVLLTAPDSPDASRFRIQTASGVKALMKLP
jgi:hypothetical protein